MENTGISTATLKHLVLHHLSLVDFGARSPFLIFLNTLASPFVWFSNVHLILVDLCGTLKNDTTGLSSYNEHGRQGGKYQVFHCAALNVKYSAFAFIIQILYRNHGFSRPHRMCIFRGCWRALFSNDSGCGGEWKGGEAVESHAMLKGEEIFHSNC